MGRHGLWRTSLVQMPSRTCCSWDSEGLQQCSRESPVFSIAILLHLRLSREGHKAGSMSLYTYHLNISESPFQANKTTSTVQRISQTSADQPSTRNRPAPGAPLGAFAPRLGCFVSPGAPVSPLAHLQLHEARRARKGRRFLATLLRCWDPMFCLGRCDVWNESWILYGSRAIR